MSVAFFETPRSDAIFSQESGTAANWRALKFFNLYRFCLSVGLLGLYGFRIGDVALGQNHPDLFLVVTWFYLTFSAIMMFIGHTHLLRHYLQVIVAVLADILVLALLIHASTGIMNSLGILINISIATGALLTVGRVSLMFAAVATIAILIEVFFFMPGGLLAAGTQEHLQAGILGGTFFATALLGHVLSARLRRIEALAARSVSDLTRLQGLNEHIIARMQSGVIVVDSDDKLRIINHSAKSLLGLPREMRTTELCELGANFGERFGEWQIDPKNAPTTLFKAISDGPEILTQFIRVTEEEDVTMIFLDDASRMAQQAQQLKLASLGRFTASIAHEIRNPLGAISHAAQLLEESSDATKDELRLIDIIQRQSERMNAIIKNVLHMSRYQRAEANYVELKTYLNDFFNDFHAPGIEHADIKVTVESENLAIYMDKSQFHQILTNLCDNGLRYSLQETGKPILHIKAHYITTDAEVVLDIIDKGPGITTDVAQHLFEPFFTTGRRGTGLGLYLAKELCEANHAHITFFNMPGTGTCFRIIFRNLPGNA